MHTPTEFCVIYRFRVAPDKEDSFVRAWSELTHAIRDQRGGLGSRLHLGEDGVWVAYAQWPDRETWERSRSLETPAPAASEAMADAVEEQFPPLYLEPKVDLLELSDAGPLSDHNAS